MLFVTAESDNALSVWRVNAAAGTLRQTVVYRDGDLGVDGLEGAWDVAVSGDLLFVTAGNFNNNGTLSVWQVNESSGTLRQTALYQDGVNGIDGLRRARGVAVGGDGDLLFVAGQSDNAISAWRINNAAVLFGVPLTIRVQSEIPVLREVMVTVIAGNGAEMAAAGPVRLSPESLSAEVTFAAGALGPGRQIFTAEATPSALLDTRAARIAVQVLVPVELTLEVPENVTVGEPFTVMVGLTEGMPLPEGVSVTAVVIFSAVDGQEIGIEEVVLTPGLPSGPASFTAPVMAGSFRVEVSGREDEASISEVTGTSAQVSVEAVAVMLQLSGPQAVTVGQAYQVTVMVDTDAPVPEGTTLEVTVSAGTEQQEVVFLTAAIPSTQVLLTAPARVDQVTVTATATVQTAPDAREVAEPAAVTLAVTVSAQDVQLMLSELPSEPVAAGSTFPVTVGAEPDVPAGTTVMVTVSLVDFSSAPVALTPSAPTASVLVMAPAEGGPAMLTAAGAATVDSTLELNVLAATATVQVQVQVLPSLRLEVPREVVARARFEVRVSAEPGVPEGATVTVTVVFEGTESAAMELTPGVRSAVFSVMAPGRLAEDLELMTSSVVTVAEPNALRVTVAAATATVDVVAQLVQLTLTVVPERMNIGEEVEVTAGVSSALLANTTLTVEVFFGKASSRQITLSDTVPSQQERFTAPATVGPLEVRARTVSVEPFGLVVAAAATQTVEVLAEGVVELTLDTPANVTVGDVFMVAVGVAQGAPLPEGTAVTATVSFRAADGAEIGMEVVELTPALSSDTLSFRAPVRSGLFRVEVSGREEAASISEVVGTSAQVSVEAVALMLRLNGPQAVLAGQIYPVTVDTNMSVPEGTTLEVTVSAGTEQQEVVVLTAANPDKEVSFTASPSAGEMRVTATATVRRAADALEVAVADAQPLTVLIFTPAALSLQPEGMLIRMGHAAPTGVYFNSSETIGLHGAVNAAVSGDLLFVSAFFGNTLSVWRVNAQAGTLRQIVVYENGDLDDGGNDVDGLEGALDIAVSGNLLFVTGESDDALSVWRVNRTLGTLRQTALYRNGDRDDGGNQVSGLLGVGSADVSGNLLFVAGHNDKALSTWRVNEFSGTLRQIAVYRNSDPEVDGLDRVFDIVASDNLLFVAGQLDNVLSVWRINAEAGTLTPTDFYRDGENGIDGLEEPWGIAISGNLLFVTGGSDEALSVWRINAEAGTLSQTALYQDGDRDGENVIDGLEGAAGVAVSGNLLFVTGEADDALSVWQINAEAGTLSQTALYRNGDRNGESVIGGLEGAGDMSVSGDGDLLFVTGIDDDALSVWHINNAAVLFGMPVTIRVQSDMPVLREVTVTVTARNLTGTENAIQVMLSLGDRFAEAMFAPGTLGPGRWIFTARADPPDVLDTRAARIAMQVLVPVELTLDVPDRVTVGDTLTVTVGVAEGTPLPEGLSVTATVRFSAVDGQEIGMREVVLTPGLSPGAVSFTAPVTAGSFRVEVSGRADAASISEVAGASAQVSVEAVAVMLQLSGPQAVAVGGTYRVTVDTDMPVPEGTALEVTVSDGTGEVVVVSLTAANPDEEIFFAAPLRAGEVRVTAMVTTVQTALNAREVAAADAKALAVRIFAPALRLQPEGMLTRMGHAVPTGVYFNSPGIFDLPGASYVAVSGDLLFVAAETGSRLSVWRVNAEAGTLRRTALYRSIDLEVDGLLGVASIAVGSSNLLFVTGSFDNALSAWRVNESLGTLRRTAVYRNGDMDDGGNTISGLLGALGAEVSGDLLFVTGFLDDALSVWRVNASSGTLRQTAVYQDDDPGVDGLARANDVTVSDNLLFVTGFGDNALSAWWINAEEGTLSQTDFHQNGVNEIDGLEGARNVAVSGDLLFVTAESDNALSVWRVNAAAGTLRQTVVYRDGDLGVDGLEGAWDVAVSGDLLFVTAGNFNNNGTLSVWQVNESSGTLRQTALYQDGVNGIDGLRRARGVAVSGDGDLLFVAGQSDNAISAWRINHAEVPFGVPLTIRVQAEIPVLREVMVTITARNGAETTAAGPVRLSPESLSAEVMFAAGALGPGRQIFTAEANPSTFLDTRAARIAVQVLAPVELTLDVPDRVTVGEPFTVMVGVAEETPLPEGSSVTATVSFGAGDDTEIGMQAVVLTSVMLSGPASFTAPVTAGIFRVEVSGTAQVGGGMVIGTSAPVTVEPVAVMLRLSGPEEAVPVGQRYPVIVNTNVAVPEGTTLEVTVSDGTALRDVFLTNTISSTPVFFTAPAQAGEVMVTATATAQTSIDSRQVAVSDAATLTVAVSALDVQLVLSELPGPVAAGSTFPVTVGTEPKVPAGTRVMVTVRLADFSSEPMALTPSAVTASVLVTAPAEAGPAMLSAAGQAAADGALALNVLAATVTVQVQAQVSLQLRLDAPGNVTVGDTFTVTVGAAEETPLPTGVEVEVMAVFAGTTMPVVLGAEQSTAAVQFTAPVTAGSYTVEVSGRVEETNALRVTVTGAFASVTAAPVVVKLQLSGPEGAVTVGQTYTVTVDADMPVPAGTTLEVTVSDATGEQKSVFLTANMPTGPTSLLAPASAGEVTVTATAAVRTALGALEVAGPAAATLAVTVSARDVQLVLSELPGSVAAGSTFRVTVGAEPEVPAGTTVLVTVSLADFSSAQVALTSSAATANVMVTAPVAGGPAILSAAGEVVAGGALELNVQAAEAATVQVQVQVSLSLRLDAPPEVTARDSFAVTVFSKPEVPAGATVTVTVVFDGAGSSPVALTSETTSAEVMLTAPDRIAANLELRASGVAEAAEPDALQVTAAAATATVRAVPQSVQLTLMAMPQRVTAGGEVKVTAGVSPALLADTTLTVAVVFGEASSQSSQQVTLTDTASSQQLTFLASAVGLLEVRVRAVAVEPGGLVEAAAAATQTVHVLAEGIVDLTLDAPGNVTVGNTFTVTVGVAAGTPLPVGTAVTAAVSFRAVDGQEIEMKEVELTPGVSSATLSFTAPVRSGLFTVQVSSREEAASIDEVVDTSAQVSVEAVAVTLRLRGPRAVTVEQSYPVTVDTDIPVPEGTTLEVTVSAGTEPQEVLLLTAANPSEEVSFTAPLIASEVMVTAIATTVRTALDAREVAVAVAEALAVLILTPAALSLQPEGMLTRMGHAVPTGVYFTSPDTRDLFGASNVAVSDDLLFVTASAGNALSVWQVNALAGTLRQTALYRNGDLDDGDDQVSGLFGVLDIAVSSSNLLFVTGALDNALSVWRVNRVSGTLRQTAVYRNGDLDDSDNQVSGLLGALGAEVSGELLFVTAGVVNGELSVWRVNESSGTLRQTVVYQDGDPGVNGLAQAFNMAVSDDLLFVTSVQDNALSVWRINAEAGTLSQTALYQDLGADNRIEEVDGRFDGLGSARGIAVSGDLLFVTGLSDNALSTWRVNAEAGTLKQTVVYQDSDLRVDGLRGAWDVAVSGDLLFVAGLLDNALSTWQINKEAGTLTQTELYRDDENGIDGLGGVNSVTVSGDLLLVTGFTDSALGVWHINNAEVPFGLPLMIRVQADMPVSGEVVVTVTARNGAKMEAIAVTLSPNILSKDAIFPARALGPGRQIFTAEAQPPALLDTGAARIAVQVLTTVELTLDAPGSVTVGDTFTVTVGVAAGTSLAESVSVTAIVSFRAADDEVIIEEIEVTLTAEQRTATEEFTAPVTAGVYTVAVSGQVEETAALRVTVTGASTSVTAEPVAVMLRLRGPNEVSVGGDYTVMVDTAVPVPAGTTLEVTVRAGTALRDVFLANTISSTPVFFTAPPRAGEVMVTATAMAQTSSGSRQVAVSDAATLTVGVSAREVPLALSEVPNLVATESTFSVTVGAAPEVLAGTTVQVTVRLAAVSSEPVLLTPGAPTASVLVTAPAAGGEATLRATGEEADDNRLELNVLPAQAAVQVQAGGTVELTLDAPGSVTVGDTFTVTVGVATETPLAESVSVTATVSFRAADGEAIIEEIEVTLTAEQRTATEEFTAPVTAGVYTLAVSGLMEETDDLRVTVTGASTSVTAEPVAVMLQLRGPDEVSVGRDYTVMVDTAVAVPAGTTLEVTVRAGTDLQEVLLTAAIPSTPVFFTAPARAGEVMVTATATAQTSTGSRQVAVSDAATLTVAVSVRDVQLVLSEVPSLVAAESTFSVTVGTEPEVPAGTTVRVTVRLAAVSSEPVLLTPGAPTASVLVTAPAEAGPATLSAAATVDSRLELNVLAATATVQVQEQVLLSLRLDAPLEVTARTRFAVTVSSEPEVPEGATVTVTVVFDGADSPPVALSAEATSAAVMLTAPGRIANGLALMTSSMVTVADFNVLQVAVTEASATVNAVAQSVQLMLLAPAVVDASAGFPVVVSVSPALLAGTTLTVEVTFGESTQQVTLTAATPSQQVRFRAPDSGRLEVSAQVLAVAPMDLVVAAAATQTVQATELATLLLTLDAPGSVTVGDTFTVTVGVATGTLLAESVSVTATVTFRAADGEAIIEEIEVDPDRGAAHRH